MKRYVFDIETDNLLLDVTKFHCGGIKDAATGEEFFYRPHQLKEFLRKLDEADIIIAHNAWGFDVPALMKLEPTWFPKAKISCSKVMSQVLNFERFNAEQKEYQRYLKKRAIAMNKGDKSMKKVVQGNSHSLARWGIALNDYKGDFSDFSEFTEEMFEYLKQDVRLGTKVYNTLLVEANEHYKAKFGKVSGKCILTALNTELYVERIMSEQILTGWQLDMERLNKLKKALKDEIDVISSEINPKLLIYVTCPSESKVALDRIREEIKQLKAKGVSSSKWPEVKSVTHVFTKKGLHTSHVARYFELDPNTTIDSSPVIGPHSRVSFDRGNINNTDQVKDYLETIGWQPDDWNWKKEGREFVKTSSKLTETSLEPLGQVGEYINKFYTLRSRLSIAEGWDERIDSQGRLHGDVFNIGTPTFRQAHNVIANLPSGNALFGPEVRSCFIASKGKVLVSADSAACQLRLLAFYMNDPAFTKEVLEGDIHQLNADIIGCTRGQAKRFIFAFLYGAGPTKLAGYIGKDVEETKKSINRYKKRLPKLDKLIQKMQKDVQEKSYIIGLDSRKVMLNKQEQHKALNYLIQSAEAIIMKATVVMLDERLKEAGIEFNHLLFYHDEHTIETTPDKAEQAKEIIMECFAEAPKQYGIPFMTCGDCKIGHDYFEVH